MFFMRFSSNVTSEMRRRALHKMILDQLDLQVLSSHLVFTTEFNQLNLEPSFKDSTPGLEMQIRQISLNASLLDEGDERVDAYEDLLLDVLRGDRSLFLRNDEVEYAWRVVDPVIEAWSKDDKPLDEYSAGSWGPPESKVIFDKNSTQWRQTMDPVS